MSDGQGEGGEKSVTGETGTVGLTEIQDRVRSNTGQLIGHPFDALVEVQRRDGTNGDWYAVVEVVERKAIPDTQDILGRYEIELDDDGEFAAYRRIDRLRRGDTDSSVR